VFNDKNLPERKRYRQDRQTHASNTSLLFFSSRVMNIHYFEAVDLKMKRPFYKAKISY